MNGVNHRKSRNEIDTTSCYNIKSGKGGKIAKTTFKVIGFVTLFAVVGVVWAVTHIAAFFGSVAAAGMS